MGRKQRADLGGEHSGSISPIQPLPEPDKLTPDSLRHILQCCRAIHGSKTPTYKSFAASLTKALPSGRSLKFSINRKGLSNVENGDAPVSYALLEAYGRLMGDVPCGLLLLASRAHAERRDYGEEGTTRFFTAVRSGLDALEASLQVKNLTPTDLRKVLDAYHGATASTAAAEPQQVVGDP